MNKFIKGVRVVLLFSVTTFAFSLSSYGSSRTLQFVGTAITHTSKIRVDQFPEFVACSVLVVNTGLQPQRVGNLKFYGFNPSNGQMSTTLGIGTTIEAVFNPGSTDLSPSCPGSCSTYDIQPSGFYVGIAYVAPAALGGKSINLCTGFLRVDDSNAANPGSVVATGAISFVSEMAITGGQFNGALFTSGSHVEVASGKLNTGAVFGGGPQTPGQDSMQMNIFCSDACQSVNIGPGSPAYCNAVCGMENNGPYRAANGDQTGNNSDRARNLSSYLEETQNVDNIFNGLFVNGSTWNGSSVSGQTWSTSGSQPFHDNSSPAAGQKMRGMVRSANPHFSGGMVQEMIVGPYESICSGNLGYSLSNFSSGDFDHSDTIGGDAGLVTATPGNPNLPPERLFCSHTHFKDNPFGYVSSGIQFSINGGAPF